MALTLISTTHTPATAVANDSTLRKTDSLANSGSSAAGVSGTILGSGDQTSVSSTGGAIAQQLQGSDVRLDKVAALQQAIAGGTYNIPAGAVADKLLSGMLGE